MDTVFWIYGPLFSMTHDDVIHQVDYAAEVFPGCPVYREIGHFLLCCGQDTLFEQRDIVEQRLQRIAV